MHPFTNTSDSKALLSHTPFIQILEELRTRDIPKELSSGLVSHQADIPIITQGVGHPSNTTTTHVKGETLSSTLFNDKISSLKISSLSELISLPPMLDSLTLEGCRSSMVLPGDLLGESHALKELSLISCGYLRSFPYPASLKNLYIEKCQRLELLPSLESIHKLASLHFLCIGNSCESLSTLTLDLFPQLKVLCIWDCPNLLSFNFSEGFSGNLESLESLEIKDCPSLKSFPDEGLPTPNLSTLLVFNCKDLNKLPIMNSLTSLATFFLHECPKIECLPYGGMPSSLIQLSISGCDKLTPQKDWGLVQLEHLFHFQFIGECIGMESFPEENLLPSCVTSLHIGKMQSLKKLDGEGFQHLNSLKTLAIHCCDKLKSFPEQGLPDSVRSLCIQKCRKLAEELKYQRGVEWHKVSHIKRIEIDDKVIYPKLL